MSENDFLGIVEQGEFRIVKPDQGPGNGPVRLTDLSMQAGTPPEVGEIKLTEHEGQAIMVHGDHASGWIYSANVVDQAGPILTAVVKQLFHR